MFCNTPDKTITNGDKLGSFIDPNLMYETEGA